MRLDQYLVSKGYFESRNKASTAVKSGYFAVNGKKIIKPAYEITENDAITALKEEKTYVARSAHKLLKAYDVFDLAWEGKTAADFGASTGGFCQVMLERGIRKVYAVDIGTAQLHPTIKSDHRIVNMEHINARYLTAEAFEDPIEVITADLSFISIKAVLPSIYQTLCEAGQAVVLVKPQFEAGSANLNKSGVVTDRRIHFKILEDIAAFAEECGFGIKGISFSGLAGESGNREYLLFIEKNVKTSISISAVAYAAVYTEDHYE